MKLVNHNYTITGQEFQTVTHQGREHWVLPVIMMVEGVHNGSGGPLLYMAEELGRLIEGWNGTPVVVDHPNDEEGNPISANTPSLTSEIVGRIYNAHMEGNKLKAEAWVDVIHLQEISPETVDYIEEHRALEVSIGVFSEELDKQGEFNNEEYRAVAQNLRPDHLALLPGAIGACSWDDGCGVRNNENQKKNEVKNLKTLNGKELFKLGIVTQIISNEFTSNEIGFREIMQNVQQKLDQLDNEIRIHFLEDLFEDNFVYRIHSRESGETSYFQRDYKVQGDGSVEFTSDPVQVRKDISFIEMESGKAKRINSNINNKKKMERTKGCPNKVDALIANALTQFTEKDKKWLSELEDAQLDAMVPVEAEKPVANDKKETKEEVVENTKTTKENGPVKINSEELKKEVKALLSESKDPNSFIDNYMPEALRGQMKSGLKMYHEKREQLIKVIVDNSKFKEDQLKGWEDADLQNLHDSVIPEGEYSAAGVTTFSANTENVSEEGQSMLNLPTNNKE